MHPIIKVMLVGGKADGLLVSVADDATEVSVTPAQYGALSGQPLSYRIVSQTIDDERYFFGVFSDAHQDSDKLTRVALTRGMKKCSVKPCPKGGVRGCAGRRCATVAAFYFRGRTHNDSVHSYSKFSLSEGYRAGARAAEHCLRP